MRIQIIGFVLIGLSLSASPRAHAQGSTGRYSWNPIQRAEVKSMSRWSLSEWLATKERNRLMDMWLAIHTPTPYEFYLSGDTYFGSRSPPSNGFTSYSSFRGIVGAYATIFGLEVQYESDPYRRYLALFNLRLLGFDSQGTNLTTFFGLRTSSEASTYRNGVAGLSMTLGLTRFFGFYLLYRHAFDSTPNDLAIIYSGDRWEAQAFIDFSFLRVYGGYYYEPENLVSGVTTSTRTAQGSLIGLKLFF